MGELIQFPQRNSGNPQNGFTQNIQIMGSPTLHVYAECQDVIHIFQTVPGRCQCGENYWGDDVLPKPPAVGDHGV